MSGLLALAGGLSILLGYRATIGAWVLVQFLVPVTFLMHRFWVISDPQAAQMQMINFMKNMSMLGGALLITQFGAGPASIDARRQPRRLPRPRADYPGHARLVGRGKACRGYGTSGNRGCSSPASSKPAAAVSLRSWRTSAPQALDERGMLGRGNPLLKHVDESGAIPVC
ncbi:MAG TPA: DoxX family protein, partial [Armatimonadota bacterium]|nr:DoxX family protein [Armatimonadota bacterium]